MSTLGFRLRLVFEFSITACLQLLHGLYSTQLQKEKGQEDCLRYRGEEARGIQISSENFPIYWRLTGRTRSTKQCYHDRTETELTTWKFATLTNSNSL